MAPPQKKAIAPKECYISTDISALSSEHQGWGRPPTETPHIPPGKGPESGVVGGSWKGIAAATPHPATPRKPPRLVSLLGKQTHKVIGGKLRHTPMLWRLQPLCGMHFHRQVLLLTPNSGFQGGVCLEPNISFPHLEVIPNSPSSQGYPHWGGVPRASAKTNPRSWVPSLPPLKSYLSFSRDQIGGSGSAVCVVGGCPAHLPSLLSCFICWFVFLFL